MAAAGLWFGHASCEEPAAASAAKPWDSVAILLGTAESRGEILVGDARGRVAVMDLASGRHLRFEETAAQATRFDVTDEAGQRKLALFAAPYSVSSGRITVLRGRQIVESGGARERVLHEGGVLEDCRFLLYSESGAHFLAGSPDGRLVTFSAEGKAVVCKHGTGSLGPAAMSANGRLAAVTSKGETWDLLSLPALEPAAHLVDRLGYPPILGFVLSQDLKRVAVSHGVICRVKLFSLTEKGAVGSLKGSFKVDEPCLAMAFDDNGDRLALGHLDGSVRLLDSRIQEGEPPRMLKEHSSWRDHSMPVRGLAFCRATATLVSVSEDGEVVARSHSGGRVFWKVNAFQSK